VINDAATIEELATTNLPLVRAALARYERDAHYEDILAAGRLGLVRAARAYDISRGMDAFSSYAWRAITNAAHRCRCSTEIGHGPRSADWTEHSRIISLDAPLGDDADGATLADTIPGDATAPGSRLDRCARRRAVMHWLRGLTPAMRRACIAVMRGRPMSPADRAVMIRLRRSNIAHALRRALA